VWVLKKIKEGCVLSFVRVLFILKLR